MKKRLPACLFFLGCISLSGAVADSSTLAGRWKLDKAASSSLERWFGETLTISLPGDGVKIERNFLMDDRGLHHVADATTLVADGRTATVNPVAYWLDTWYNNTYIGADHQKTVRGEWIDGGGTLRVETMVWLNAQQGEVPVHIRDDYRLSADGRTLRLSERRSTRDQTLTYVFTRE